MLALHLSRLKCVSNILKRLRTLRSECAEKFFLIDKVHRRLILPKKAS